MKKLGNLEIISIKTTNPSTSIYGTETHEIVVDHELDADEIQEILTNLWFGPEIKKISKNDNGTWTYSVQCHKD